MFYVKFYKYQGAGNDFLIADNRDGRITEKDGVLTAVLEDGTVWSKSIAELCDRRYGVGADGLMLLDAGTKLSSGGTSPDVDSPEANPEMNLNSTDFHMTYFNSDGSGGMMCGNGGRCIVAFAYDCGVIGYTPGPHPGQEQSPASVHSSELKPELIKYIFTAADGLHEAYILNEDGCTKTVRLKMKDVEEITKYDSLKGVTSTSKGAFLDTGTRHYVRFVKNIEAYDIIANGRDIRYNAVELQPVGANVNYVEPCSGFLKVRTYEKGVEDETFACGTGIVASVLAAYSYGIAPHKTIDSHRYSYSVQAKRDALMVDFLPSQDDLATSIFLTGPAAKVCEILF